MQLSHHSLQLLLQYVDKPVHSCGAYRTTHKYKHVPRSVQWLVLFQPRNENEESVGAKGYSVCRLHGLNHRR